MSFVHGFAVVVEYTVVPVALQPLIVEKQVVEHVCVETEFVAEQITEQSDTVILAEHDDDEDDEDKDEDIDIVGLGEL